MERYREPERAEANPFPARISLREEHNFEAIFQIPPTHRLVLARSRSQGNPLSAISWEHNEYDADGLLIARYTSVEQITAEGRRRSQWLKFSCDGDLVGEHDGLT